MGTRFTPTQSSVSVYDARIHLVADESFREAGFQAVGEDTVEVWVNDRGMLFKKEITFDEFYEAARRILATYTPPVRKATTQGGSEEGPPRPGGA